MKRPRADELKNAIHALMKRADREVRLMEVCGTHTVSVFRHGIRSMLPEGISLFSGPGCPVCVTPARDIATAIKFALTPGVVLATFGDMMRVPTGRNLSEKARLPVSLNEAKAEGADVRVYYSPMDALKAAEEIPGKKMVFFATGFETTSPLVAATLREAEKKGIGNFLVYSVHKLVPPALRALVEAPEVNIDGLMLPGHVSTIIGTGPYSFLAREFNIPSVITGFVPEDILEGILMLLDDIVQGSASVQIQYRSVVRDEGNPAALKAIDECFKPCKAEWRGIGAIESSGLCLREKYRAHDASAQIPVDIGDFSDDPAGCSCGEVLRGLKTPPECTLFSKACTPAHPVGACMVSTEGSCAAYYRYGGSS